MVQTSSSFTTNLQCFYLKLQHWRCQVMQGNVAMFEKLSRVIEKNWRTWWEFEDIFNRPLLIPWNWVPTTFPWAQGGRSCTYTKSVLYLSGYSQYSRWITEPFLWYSECFIITLYFSWNATFLGSGVLCMNYSQNCLNRFFEHCFRLPQRISARVFVQL